jgi:phosphoglycerate dehydrogenase-like enzyme
VFARAKHGMHIVNVARGSLIDQDALRRALDDGCIALATLDTVTPEPLPEDHWLRSHCKVRVSPHVSWGSRYAWDRMLKCFGDNLVRYSNGQPLFGLVDVDEGY